MPQGPTGSAPGMPQADPLAELRDIHMPGAIETWPPAIGWWILLAIAIFLVLAGLYWLYSRWRANRYRREAIAELNRLRADYQQHGEDSVYLAEYQSLLKRVALTRYAREDVASLTGESWVAFLDRTSRSQEFSMGKGQVLIDSNYMPEPEADVAALHEMGVAWIRRHKLELAA
jgi:hypothetical protein